MDWITLGSATLRIIDHQLLQLWASSDYKYCATKDSEVSRLTQSEVLAQKYLLQIYGSERSEDKQMCSTLFC